MIIRILLFTPNIMKSLGFFTEGLGLKCIHMSETFAELQDSNNTTLILSKAPSLVYTYSGFTPLIMFQTERFDECLEKSKKYGCIDEADTESSDIGRLAYLKSPEGLSFALKEVKFETLSQEARPAEDSTTEELKRFIKKLNL
jgi:predicted enzyme related to lactoylglutathione lyase